MSNNSDFWRVTLRLRPDLKDKVKDLAKKRRWSANDFIEEAIITAIGSYEGK